MLEEEAAGIGDGGECDERLSDERSKLSVMN